jgi:hypothetical protein
MMRDSASMSGRFIANLGGTAEVFKDFCPERTVLSGGKVFF